LIVPRLFLLSFHLASGIASQLIWGMMMQTLLEMYLALRRYGRWADVAQHFLRAERELLSALTIIVRTLKDAAAPHAKEDPFASLLFEVFHFIERGMMALTPQASEVKDSELLRTTQRRALLAIRDVLLDERASVTPDALQTRHRSEVIDAILLVIDRELARLEDLADEPLAAQSNDDEKSEVESAAISAH
jgi:hypothetical protein